ncbi:MAG: LemA family protein [Nitrospirota bacterium]|nr:LemA family protein [Nitrospirota bacterium]
MIDWSIIVPGALGVTVFLWLIASYNGLIRIRNLVENSWNQIDVQLKRRHDLIPNLMECVKGYMKHEDGIFAKVAQARNLAQQAQKRDEKMEAEGQLTGALMSFISVVEAYPELKANQNFMDLQEELKSTENKIGFARQYYNDVVMDYNNQRQSFPTMFVASFCNFAEEAYWKIQAAEERMTPTVNFSS